MDSLSEALYNEKRNAIPSWQGYHYQAMIAIYKYLEFILQKFIGDNIPEQAIVKIEWMEDFVIQDNGNIQEIYQVKKTLTEKNRAEVLQNFILQYKLMGQKNTQWKIVFDQPDDCAQLTETEFDQIYKDYIEDTFIFELNQLLKNVANAHYWEENLKLVSSSSQLKNVRGYIRKWMELKGCASSTLEERKLICEECIKVVCDKLKKKANDFNTFNEKLEFLHCKADDLEQECKQLIVMLSQPNVGSKAYIAKNAILSEQDILNKLYCKIYNIMMLLHTKTERNNFVFSIKELQEVFIDIENTNYKWEKLLWDKREEFLELVKDDLCSGCKTDEGETCNDEQCIVKTIKNWKMREMVDNMSLELPVFNAKDAVTSLTNKVTNDKFSFLIEVFEQYKDQLDLEKDTRLNFKDQSIFLSNILVGKSMGVKKRTKINILENFWEHIDIYKDYDNILTKEFQEVIEEGEIRSAIKNYQINLEGEENQKNKKVPSFRDISKVSFITEVE